MISKYQSLRKVLLIIALGIGSWSCELLQPLPVNPYDPQNLDYQPPKTVILQGPSETITDKSITIIWHQESRSYWGDSLNTDLYGKIQYRYRLNQGIWSPWFPDTSLTLNYLDDTTYSFEVMSKYPTEIEEEGSYPTLTFTMSAYSSALLFSPRMTIVSATESESVFSVAVKVKEVIDMMGTHIAVDYDAYALRLVQATVLDKEADFLSQNGGDLIEFVAIDSIIGSLTVDLALVMASPAGLSGSGTILNLDFERTALSDTVLLHFGDDSAIRSSTNEDILEDKGDGVVYVW